MSPSVAPKQEETLRFGILGAAAIAPMALIIPAKTHPEVIVHAVAARSKTCTTTFAEKHGIPVVKDSYDALKALAKGKHVLLEKQSSSNSQDTEILFHHLILSRTLEPVVLMEAFHSRFTPAWKLFMSTLHQPNVAHVLATAAVPSFINKDDDIRFDYDIGGGALLDLGTYIVAALRSVFGTEPIECLDAELGRMAASRHRCDHTFRAKLKFSNGGVGEVDGTLRGPNTRISLPTITVTNRPVAVPEEEKNDEKEETKVTRTRKVVFTNFVFAPHYHRINVVDEFEVTESSTLVRKYTRTETKKAYTFREMGEDHPGDPFWSTYRHMLAQFVNKIKRREGTGVFMSHEDTISQARALDMIYIQSGLGMRPSSKYRLEGF
ncbi:hypothetical protein BX600DRAFT_440362 [Xylariales sp. PMI_506]|nr:hypothetical protein BX600DRAFT_440362 [Xylariales sp. PMI_506]